MIKPRRRKARVLRKVDRLSGGGAQLIVRACKGKGGCHYKKESSQVQIIWKEMLRAKYLVGLDRIQMDTKKK